MTKRISTGIISDADKQRIEQAKTEKRFTSSLKCFSSTFGIRPGEFSVIVGPAGNGKSTLCKTISIEATISGHKVYHLLSEENPAVYKSLIEKSFRAMAKDKTVDSYLERLLFESMLDWGKEHKRVDYFLSYLEEVINEHQPEMIIFDNFTTSFIGSLPIGTQGSVIDDLRKMASEYDLSIIGVFHTTKGTDIYNKVLNGEDVRGNASATNAGSYNYILSTYFRANPPRAILNVDKARYHPETNKTFWELLYDKELGIYTADRKVDYEEVKTILDETSGRKKAVKKEIVKW